MRYLKRCLEVSVAQRVMGRADRLISVITVPRGGGYLLGRVLVVDSLNSGIQILKDRLSWTLVSLEGDIITPVGYDWRYCCGTGLKHLQRRAEENRLEKDCWYNRRNGSAQAGFGRSPLCIGGHRAAGFELKKRQMECSYKKLASQIKRGWQIVQLQRDCQEAHAA